MNFDKVFTIAESARTPHRLSSEDVAFVRAVVPEELESFPRLDLPKVIRHGIMRSHFHHGYPKGTHCCVQCTLAVYTTLEAGAIRYFDCSQLHHDVSRLITERKWRFVKLPNAKMVQWALRRR
jgi:hypothetical protein